MADVDTIFSRLLQKNPFFGFLITSFKLIKSDKIPTAGVSVQNKTPVLMYNPKFLSDIDNEKGVGVLEHETLHILHRHFSRGKGTHQFISNIAMDMEINQLIKWFIEDKGSNKNFEYCWPNDDMELNRQYEYYYNELMKGVTYVNVCQTCGNITEDRSKGKNKDKQDGGQNSKKQSGGEQGSDQQGDSKSGQGNEGSDGHSHGSGEPCPTCGATKEEQEQSKSKYGKIVDDHSGWGEMDDTQKAELDEIVRGAIQSARKAGQDLGKYEALISDFFKVKENWQQMLRKWVSDKVKTNQRFKLAFDRRRKTIPARVKALGTEVVIGFDSSGSCMDDFQMFASQIKKIYDVQKKQSKFWIATCDMQVHIQQFKGKKLNLEDCGGGTDMRVLINEIYTNKKLIQNNRLCILFTDGETPWFDTCPYPGMKLLVVYTEQHAKMNGDGIWFKSIVAKEFNTATIDKE